MSVAFEKVEGVEKVDVSLNEGTATLKLRPRNHLTIERVREIVRKNGFTPKETRVRVAGEVIERNGKPALEVAGPDEVLLLSGSDQKLADLRRRTGKTAVLSGTIGGESRSAPAVLSVE